QGQIACSRVFLQYHWLIAAQTHPCSLPQARPTRARASQPPKPKGSPERSSTMRLRRALLCLLLRYYVRADDLDEEDLFDLDGEGDYEDPESYIEYDQALYYDGPDDYYDGIEQFNMEDMADYPGEVSPELLEKIFGENPASGDELDALFEELGLGPEGVLYADDGYGEAFFDDEHPDQHKSTVKLVEPELGDVEEGLYERFGEGEDEL
ncbi:unnamed protein product, partial [Pelagomonas calceolata]